MKGKKKVDRNVRWIKIGKDRGGRKGWRRINEKNV